MVEHIVILPWNHYSSCHPNIKASHKSFSEPVSSNICLISPVRRRAFTFLPQFANDKLKTRVDISTLPNDSQRYHQDSGLGWGGGKWDCLDWARIKMTPRSKKCMKWHFVDYKDYNINSDNYSRGSCGNFHLKARFIDIWLHQSRTVQLFCNLKDFYRPCIYFTFLPTWISVQNVKYNIIVTFHCGSKCLQVRCSEV